MVGRGWGKVYLLYYDLMYPSVCEVCAVRACACVYNGDAGEGLLYI